MHAAALVLNTTNAQQDFLNIQQWVEELGGVAEMQDDPTGYDLTDADYRKVVRITSNAAADVFAPGDCRALITFVLLGADSGAAAGDIEDIEQMWAAFVEMHGVERRRDLDTYLEAWLTRPSPLEQAAAELETAHAARAQEIVQVPMFSIDSNGSERRTVSENCMSRSLTMTWWSQRGLIAPGLSVIQMTREAYERLMEHLQAAGLDVTTPAELAMVAERGIREAGIEPMASPPVRLNVAGDLTDANVRQAMRDSGMGHLAPEPTLRDSIQGVFDALHEESPLTPAQIAEEDAAQQRIEAAFGNTRNPCGEIPLTPNRDQSIRTIQQNRRRYGDMQNRVIPPTSPPAIDWTATDRWACPGPDGEMIVWPIAQMEDKHLWETVCWISTSAVQLHQQYAPDQHRNLAPALGAWTWLKAQPTFRALVQAAITREITFPKEVFRNLRNYLLGRDSEELTVSEPWKDPAADYQHADMAAFLNEPLDVPRPLDAQREFGRELRNIDLD